LNARGVKALVVGAHAVAFHAKPRYTKDLDLFIEPTEQNAGRILEALRDFGFGGVKLSAADLSTPGKVVQLGYPPHRIDLITQISGVSFADAWAGRVAGTLLGETVQFIGKRELMRNKEAAGRPQDQIDLEWLRAGP
jgi:hypothetical protein